MFPLMHEEQFEINTGSEATPTYSAIASGINNVEPGNNEGLAQDNYLDGDGHGETDVISAQLILAFTGHRKPGDAAQDFILGKLNTLGASRRTDFKWTRSNGDLYEGECTIANINPGSGDAGAKQEISFEIHFNGAPTFTPAV